MKLRNIASGVGTVLLIFPAALLFPFLVGLLYKESFLLLFGTFIVPALLSLSLGALLTQYAGRADSERVHLRPIEALVSVAITWVLVAVIGAFPFMVNGILPNFVDAFFESVSGFTATGSSVITDVEVVDRSIIFWRSWSQWLGGLGIIVLMVALFSQIMGGTKAGMLLMKSEVAGQQTEKLVPRIKDTAKILLGIYSLFTFVQILLLVIMGMPVFEALTQSMSTLATGGFSIYNDGFAHYEGMSTYPFIISIFTLFMIAGSTSFTLHYHFLKEKGNWKVYFKNPEFLVFIGILFTIWTIITIDLVASDIYSPLEAFGASALNSTSIMSTTGFASKDFAQWPALSQFLLVVSMIMGGMTGSTCGGLKIVRLMIAYKVVRRALRRIGHPRAVLSIKLGDVTMPERIVQMVGIYIFAYISIFLLGSFLMMLTGLDAISGLSSVAATMGGVGPGLNIVGPMSNYSSVHWVGKIVLSMMMWLGRLELLTVLILFRPSTYRK